MTLLTTLQQTLSYHAIEPHFGTEKPNDVNDISGVTFNGCQCDKVGTLCVVVSPYVRSRSRRLQSIELSTTNPCYKPALSSTSIMADSYLILAINAGSSSLKLSLYSTTGTGEDPKEIAVAEVTSLSAPPASLKYTVHPHETDKTSKVPSDVTDPDAAFKFLLDKLIHDSDLPQLKQREDVRYACHRIVHGGDFGKVHVIDRSTFHALEELSDLAPLHNATGLAIVRTVHEELPKCTNMAYFDSQFHATIPKHIRTYAIDQKVAEKNKLRKYGFHGISYAFITRAVARYLGKEAGELNMIALHLGSGASACCVKEGKSLDTTMGLTPVSGLPGGSRSGDVDPR